MTYQGVTCEKCGAVFPNGSSAELHRMEAHTPLGVKKYYDDLDTALKLKRGEILSIRHCQMVEYKELPLPPIDDDDDWLFRDRLDFEEGDDY